MADGLFNYQDPQMLRDAYTQQFVPKDDLSLQQIMVGAAAGMGSGLGRLFGGKAPQEAENDLMRDIFSQASQATTDPVERMTLAAQGLRKAGMEGRAVQLEQEIAKMSAQLAQSKKAQAEAAATEAELQRENQLREALSALPENATPEQYLAIVRKFGSPDKIMTSIQTSMDREEQRKQALEMKKMELDNRLEVARQQGADRALLAQMQIQGRRELAQFAASLKQTADANKPPTPAQIRQEEKALAKAEGREELKSTLDDMKVLVENIAKAGGMTDTTKTGFENLQARGSASALGQTLGGALGTQTQADRDVLDSLRLQLLMSVSKATGVSAQQLNSNVEFQTWLKSLGSSQMSKQANLEIIEKIRNKFLKEDKPSEPSSGGASGEWGIRRKQ